MRALVIALLLAFAAPAVAADYSAAIADSHRPAADTARDAARKPADMLEFIGLKPGMKVMDLIPGSGYFTRLFAAAVGPKGHVYAYQPTEFDGFLKDKEPAVNAVAKEYPNVTVVRASVNALTVPDKLNVIWTSQNYHDLKNGGGSDTAQVNKAAFAALKHGGLYIVLDHAAAPGSGARDTNTLHRIDPATVKAEVMAAGFVYIGDSAALANPADDHTKAVFDPAIRGHTDQFVLKFKKP
ncbi:class I SAM-dependent methyltransferase [Rhizomicrobium electricum]|uniref:Class I SAM-dependent methyltransferase n=1 Tax=Rhizomicrobium electricum TaxID=480070 RepID=A0ABN1EDW9_9PROT|nr:class I SAM-dependent methyltransferase [Rhizomicrobium electricum]NIJ48699.1 putative methyltransferase [Rhizomicrobium electricum]